MKFALILTAALVGAFAVYRLAAWAQRRGWVNFRATGSGVNAGLAQVNRFVDPPTEHVAEVKQQKPPANTPGGPPVV